MSDSPQLEERNLPARIRNWTAGNGEFSLELGKPLNEVVHGLTDEMEKRMIEKALEATGGNKTRAAQLLGISRKTLFNKIREFDVR